MSRLSLPGAPLALLLISTASFAVTPISEGVPIDPAATAKLIVSRDRNAPNACDLQPVSYTHLTLPTTPYV